MLTLIMIMLFIGFFRLSFFSLKVFGKATGLLFGIFGYLVLAIIAMAVISTFSFIFPLLAVIGLITVFKKCLS